MKSDLFLDFCCLSDLISISQKTKDGEREARKTKNGEREARKTKDGEREARIRVERKEVKIEL